MSQKRYEGTAIYLCELNESFFTQYMKAFSERVRSLLHVSDSASELDYLRVRLEKKETKHALFFCIFDKQTEQLIGAVEIRDQRETSNQLYGWLHEDHWGFGKYQEALRIAAQEYFIRTNHIFFSAHVDVKNKRSYRAHKKCGFADIGICNGPRGRQYQLVLRKGGGKA